MPLLFSQHMEDMGSACHSMRSSFLPSFCSFTAVIRFSWKKKWDFIKLSMGSNSSVSVGCVSVRHLSTDVCRDVLVSLLPFVFMVVFTCYMYWGPNRVDPNRVDPTRLQEPWVRHYLANTFLSRTECQGPWWTPGPQSMISNPDPEELTILVA